MNLADRVEMLIPPMPWDRTGIRAGGGAAKVVLLHGLGRSWHAMNPLARVLRSEGFETYNLPYPSLVKPLDWILRHVRERVASFAGDGPVHFVGHSLGGIIVRILLQEPQPWHPGRLVMLAPPNHGSEIIDWASHQPCLRPLLSQAARALASDGVPSTLPPLPGSLEAIAIMGSRSSIPLFRNLLGPENDGIVSARRGYIDGLRGFHIIDADHTFIQIHPDAIRHTLAFLKADAAAVSGSASS